jgi:hypothetical protein
MGTTRNSRGTADARPSATLSMTMQVPSPEDFPKECSLSLTRREAECLAERIRLNPACSGSGLAELVAQKRCNMDVAFAWQHPHCAELPQKLRELLDHAQNFSEVTFLEPCIYDVKAPDGESASPEGMDTT